MTIVTSWRKIGLMSKIGIGATLLLFVLLCSGLGTTFYTAEEAKAGWTGLFLGMMIAAFIAVLKYKIPINPELGP